MGFTAREGVEVSKEGTNTANWNQPAHNRSSFQRVQQLFPTARLARGSATATDFEVAAADLSQISYTGMDRQSHTLDHFVDSTYTDAFLVLKDGVLVCEQYFNDMAPHSHHLLNSVSKSFLGMLAGIVIRDGLLDPERTVASYLPELGDSALAQSRVQDALDMTAAVRYGEDYDNAGDDFWHEAAVVGWRPQLVTPSSPRSLVDYAASLNVREHEDGEHFHYRTVLTNVVGMVVQRAAGQPLQTLLQERLWQPMGPEQDATVVVDPMGFPYMGAGMSACARDLARFGELLRNDGFYNGQQIVPAAWVQQTRSGSDQLRHLFAHSDYARMIQGGHYHNQTWGDAAAGILLCVGIHGQTIHVNQNTGVVIVKLSSHPYPSDLGLFGETWRALGVLTEALLA
jgi:CubicO group peptidase (beta-lactamase class C family)